MSDLEIRPLRAGETDLFRSFPHPPVPGVGMESVRSYPEMLSKREYRPEHTWVALRDGAVVARACWWAGPDDDEVSALDWLEAEPGPDQVELGTRLLRTAHEQMFGGRRPADYHLFLPPGWRELPEARAAADFRLAAAAGAGLEPFVERLSYRWSAAQDGLVPRSSRLAFRPAADAQILEVLRRLLEGTLDAHGLRDVAERGVEGAAEEQLAELAWFPSPRDWWQLAYTGDGEPAGLIVPARNYARPVIGYLGVLPEHRGHGYVDDLLAEMMWRLAEAAPGEEVGADTDVGNTPMAAAFTRAGFRTTAVRIVLTPPVPAH